MGYSSQWTGWVPGSCSGDGNLGASTFSVSNLKIQGTVIKGPEPRRCSSELAEELSKPPLRPAYLPAPACQRWLCEHAPNTCKAFYLMFMDARLNSSFSNVCAF